jgi:hypothetical protein
VDRAWRSHRAHTNRDPTSTILYGIVRDHFETFRAHAASGAARRVDAAAAGQPDSLLRRPGPARRVAGRAGPGGVHGVDASHVERSVEPEEHASRARPSRARAYQWAELMRRTFGFEVLACPRCGGRLRVAALIEEASVVQRILRHLGLPTEVPEARPARAPPGRLETLDDQS